jgi:hypothetical protein
MNPIRSSLALAALLVVTTATAGSPAPAESPTPAPAAASAATAGYVDGSAFRALIDEDKEIVEVNLDGPILQAIAKKKKGSEDEGSDAEDLFGKLKSIHAVIGTVKSSASTPMAMIQQLDQKLAASGWQRITRIKDEDSWVSVLTHVTANQIDGLVAIIYDMNDKELVFANLVGQIDLTRLGEIGERLNVPGLDQVPGAR